MAARGRGARGPTDAQGPGPRGRGAEEIRLRCPGRRGGAALLIGCVAVTLFGGPARSSETAPTTVSDWLAQQHRFSQRYLNILRQAAHDYAYNYKTPMLLMPIAMDVFTGYVARINAIQARLLYPALRAKVTAPQWQKLELIVHDQEGQGDTARYWQRALEEGGEDVQLQAVATHIDYLAQMVNRVLVLQEEYLLPLLETAFTPQEQRALLQQIAAAEREAFGVDGAERYQQLLACIEEAIKQFGGRIW